ncbi:MAG: hypothetical protein LIO78_02450 [Clostridiales bacterium]|nr:hypothetical protein [Clostridiales bacterium]
MKIDVEYCQKCGRLMMNYTSFCLYRERFGVLIRNLRMISSETFNGELTLAQESPLRLCGYTVSQAEGLTESERHYILAKMIHDNIMPKTEVIRYLEHFINMNGAKEGNELALSKWENDLKFVHNYRIDTQPEVYITKVEKY